MKLSNQVNILVNIPWVPIILHNLSISSSNKYMLKDGKEIKKLLTA